MEEISSTALEVIVRVVDNVFDYSYDGGITYDPDRDLNVEKPSQITFLPAPDSGWKFSALSIEPVVWRDEIGISDFTIQVSGDKMIVQDRHLFNGDYNYTVAVITPDEGEHIGDPKIVNRDAPKSQ